MWLLEISILDELEDELHSNGRAKEGPSERTPMVKAEQRETWNTKVDFLLSVVGFAVDLGNIWRFPYLCFKNGGGVFLIPYTCMVLFTGIPLFYMELCLGQYYKKGAITTWGRICPLFKGIGYCVVIIAFYTDFFYNVVLAWGLHFFYTSFTSNLPWASCNNSFNSPGCYEPVWHDGTDRCRLLNESISTEKISASEEYFYKGFLGLHEPRIPTNHVYRDLGNLGAMHWDIALSLFVVYLICYFSLWKGIQMSGKVVWFTALFPYFVLGALFIRGITLPGYEKGIEYYLKPRLEKLWVLGYMSCKSGKPIEKVAQEGPGLVFVVYPEAIATMPWAPLWSVLFFLMLMTLGLDSSFGGSEAIITGLSDEFPIIKNHREIFIALLFSFYMCIGLFMCTDAGILIMEWLIVYGTTWGLLIAVLCETVVIAYIYGIMFALSAAFAIPAVGIYKLIFARGNNFCEKFKRVIMPYRKRPEQSEYIPIGGNNNVADVIL
ncbi:hypothetical protein WR25_00393 [Diploscapter pachys]|uniref:Transporter n=1 Tax=Diploscapter pachys TaxID=2018661 RepID=A0A2A2JZE0_9BILA|nr:hypothetical protein WR25_00393 [Diploscapter pachys]